MSDLNIVIIEERVDRVQKQLILYSRRRTIRIRGNDAVKPDQKYTHVKVSTVHCEDDEDSYLIRIKAYRGGSKRKDLIKASTI